MTRKSKHIIEVDAVVVKFAGDSGDGMQLTGSQFSDASAFVGHDLATFPDFPSEIRAPQGTIAGVSGFQVHVGKEIHTSGDLADVLVAMNPAALRANMKWVKPGATIIIDVDNFDDKNYKKAGYGEDPLEDGSLDGYNVVKAPITSLTRDSIKELGIDLKTVDKTKNQFASGMLFWLFNRDINLGNKFIADKFRKKPILVEANQKVLQAGYHFAETIEALESTYHIPPVEGMKGLYRNITGNVATAWGLMAAAEKAGLPLFLGSYPITPATEILQELSHHKDLGVKTFQAEDEIAGVCSAIGASFAGNFGITTTSGPGLSLKSEAIGLAVMTELPLVIVDVQRGGPATGLPTKPEQSDLLQALHGRNGESPVIVVAASTPADCFYYAYMASKLSLEHMTPVILLTDGYLANGSELWAVPSTKDLPPIKTRVAKAQEDGFDYLPYKRDHETLAREWAHPGTVGLRHRVGGLEKEDVSGIVSHDPINHQKMVNIRKQKVERVAQFIPEQEVYGDSEGEVLVVGWGGTYGALYTAVKDLREEGKSISLCHIHYINPLPRNLKSIFKRFKKIIICEINTGQLAYHLRAMMGCFDYYQFNKVQGLPFFVAELKAKFNEMLED
jgi:2-oxoglutarate/2-oxoacid ferredoxin oxidoreductase subunit alpha